MREPPLYDPVVNESGLTRLLVMEYDEDRMSVHVLDFLHSERETGFEDTIVTLRIRLRDDGQRLLAEAGFGRIDSYGDGSGTSYDRVTAR